MLVVLSGVIRNADEHRGHEGDQRIEHPRREQQHRAEHREDLRHERQRRLVDLRDRLKHADQQPDHEAQSEHRRGHEQHRLERAASQIHDHVRRHWKDLTMEPTTRYHPSASTNRISLNGSEITTGGSSIMPIDMSTLATTRSTMRNGM